jgi:heptosyltransferase-3
VIALTHLGDAVLLLPFLDLLSRTAAEVDLVVKPPIDQLVAGHKKLRKIHVFSCPWVGAGPWLPGLRAWLKLTAELRRRTYDLAIVTHPHELSSLTARFANARVSVGRAHRGDHVLDIPVFPSAIARHAQEEHASVLLALGVREELARWSTPPVSPYDARGGSALVKSVVPQGCKALAVHPGSGGTNKLWPWRNFAYVLDQVLRRRDAYVVLLGGQKEESSCRAIEQDLSHHQGRIVNLCGKLNIGGLVGALSACSAYLGNDSGPSHLAAACGIPSTVVFGPASSPDIWRPLGPRVQLQFFPAKDFFELKSASCVATGLLDDTIVDAQLPGDVHQREPRQQ